VPSQKILLSIDIASGLDLVRFSASLSMAISISSIESYNSQFRNFANSLIFLSNKVNELISKGKNINDIDQKINFIFNNTKFKVDNYEIFIIQNNQQKINFYSSINNLINSLNIL
jgi:hypothetical protein